MIRPEARAALGRFREAIVGLGVVAIGFWWAFFTGGGVLHWIGYAVLLIGAALTVTGLQKARFRTGQGGPGIVQVVEGRITYFGPLSGGVADLGNLRALTLDPTARPPHWLLHQTGQLPLAIPLTAEGADALFDAFAVLPGIRTERMLREMKGADRPVTIWQAPDVQDRTPRLH